MGCKTVSIACNKGSEVGKEAELAIEPSPVLRFLQVPRALSLVPSEDDSEYDFDRFYGWRGQRHIRILWFDVQQTNKKLVVRAQNITMAATGLHSAKRQLRRLLVADGNAKLTIVMLLTQMPVDEAKAKLEAAHGRVRGALVITVVTNDTA